MTRTAGRLLAVSLVGLVGLAMLATGGGFVGTAAADEPTCDGSDDDFAGGDGSSGESYEIEDVEQLQCVGDDAHLDDHFVLIDDIDASDTENWNDGNGFEPIGDSNTAFTGTFEGNGHDIDGLSIDRGGDYIGLFGYIGSGGAVENVGLESVDISGGGKVGGLAGQIDGTVTNAYTTGAVSGGSQHVAGLTGRSYGSVSDAYSTATVDSSSGYVGGLIGLNYGSVDTSFATGDVDASGFQIGGLVGENKDSGSSITDSYATGDVTAGGSQIGGLVGWNEGGSVDTSYSTGSVSGDDYVGGLVGRGSGVSDSYWDTDSSSVSSSNGGTGLTTDEMQGSSAESEMDGFDFSSIWETVENSEGDTTGDGYPIIQSVDRQAQLEAQNVNAYAGGDGTAGTPYEIANWHHLDNVRDNLDKEFVLTTGLNSGTAGYGSVADSSANSNNGFDPIGDSGAPFTGTFDGDNDTISDLSIDRGSTDYVGLFGDVGSAGRVERVGVESAGITGDYFVGGIAGNSSGTITASNTSGQVSGDGTVGGLVGQNRGTISGSFATGDISGKYDVGGLVGKNKASITTSYVTGSATGEYDIGGLVGSQNGGTVTESYATADVTSNTDGAGGLVGQNPDDSSVSRSYASGTVDGPKNVGGLVGNNGGAVSNSYWDIQQTGQETSDGDAVGIFTRDMVGANALDSANMSALTTPPWETVTASTPGADDDGYPILQGPDAGPQIRTPDTSVSNALYVDILNGGTIVLGFEASDTVLSVKKQIEARTGLAADRQDLIFAGKALDDDRTLSDYNVQKGSTLTLVQAALYGGGDGSESTPYEIANWHHLDNVSQNTGAEFKLTADLDSGTAGYDEVASDTANSNKGFDPIGDPGNQFTGTFDGDDHTISGLNIDRKNTQNVGLFGIVSGGTVENVGVENVEINGSEYVGGLAGRNNAAVTNSYATGDVNGTKYVGGLIGENLEDVSESYATGNVNATRNVGGLVGENEGNVTESYATGNVKGDEDYGGGLAGLNYGNVTKSYATGDVDGDIVGGLVGFNDVDSGSNGYVNNSYATGDISGTQDAGGLVGFNPGGTVEDAYWDVDTTGQSSSAGSPDANGLTTAEMQRFAPQVTMDGFSFESPETWLVTGGYPALAWESVTELTVDTVEATSPTVAEDESGTITVTANESGTDAGEGVTIEVVNNDSLDGFATGDTAVTDTNGQVTFTFDEPTDGSYSPEFAWADNTSVSDTATVTVRDAPENGGGSGGSSGSTDTGGDRSTADDSSVGTGTVVSGTQSGDGSVSFTVSASDDDGPITLELSATDADGTDDEDESGGNDDSEGEGENTVSVDSLSITPTESGSREFDISVHEWDADIDTSERATESDDTGTDTTDVSDPQGATDGDRAHTDPRTFLIETGLSPLGYVEVTHTNSDSDIDSVTFRFRIRKDALNQSDFDPSGVALYRNGTDGWTRLPTDEVGENSTHYVFKGTSPGLSLFTIASAQPAFEVMRASSRSETLTASEAVTVNATVRNLGGAAGTYTAELRANGTVVATSDVDLASNSSRTVSLSFTPLDPGEYTLTVGTVSAGAVSVQSNGTRAESTSADQTLTEPTPPEQETTQQTTVATDNSSQTASANGTRETTTDASGPGFGVLVLIGAFLIVIVLLQRRS